MKTQEQQTRVTLVSISKERHIELLRKETDPVVRAKRKSLAYAAMYGGDPDARVILPDYLVEQSDIDNQGSIVVTMPDS